jgi:hypothetical protein
MRKENELLPNDCLFGEKVMLLWIASAGRQSPVTGHQLQRAG